jgi:hypothetical protein
MDKIVYDWQYRVVEAIYKLDAEETERAVFLLRNHTREQLLNLWRGTRPVGEPLPQTLDFLQQ